MKTCTTAHLCIVVELWSQLGMSERLEQRSMGFCMVLSLPGCFLVSCLPGRESDSGIKKGFTFVHRTPYILPTQPESTLVAAKGDWTQAELDRLCV